MPDQPAPHRVLIANRGEVAIRIARAVRAQGWRSVAVASTDDAASAHRSRADEVHKLSGSGPRAYMDCAALLAAAQAKSCTAVHPGYGFLSENADFAVACADAGLRFIGPAPAVLCCLGDKSAALALARPTAAGRHATARHRFPGQGLQG